MIVHFNIGLDDLPRIINSLPPKDFTITRLHRYSGEYLGQWEQGYSFSAIVELYSPDIVSELAEKLGQECIAVYYPGFFQGEIIYSKSFTGEKITFDPQYFHMP